MKAKEGRTSYTDHTGHYSIQQSSAKKKKKKKKNK